MLSVPTQAFWAGLAAETSANQRCELQPSTPVQELGADVRRVAISEGWGAPGCPARRACSRSLPSRTCHVSLPSSPFPPFLKSHSLSFSTHFLHENPGKEHVLNHSKHALQGEGGVSSKNYVPGVPGPSWERTAGPECTVLTSELHSASRSPRSPGVWA